MSLTSFDKETYNKQKKFFVNLTLTSVLVLLFLSVIWYWFSEIFNAIPIIFSAYSVAVLLILIAVNFFRLKLNWAFILWALVSVLGNFMIVIYSGGINSQFTFVFVIVCYGGYMASLKYGKIISCFLLLIIALIYVLNLTNLIPQTTVIDNFLLHFNFLSLLFVLVLFIGFGVISAKASYRLVKAKEEIIRQKEKIELQKQVVEQQHSEIVASINYAKRIQEAILPSRNAISSAIKNGFVFYLPKDVVAGDFYWMETYANSLSTGNDRVYIAAADCTGHGVPGAMVSVVCSNALSKALLEEGNENTGKLLDRTRELVVQQLAKSGEEVKDGMDLSLIRIDFENLEILFSGANNPLYIVRNEGKEVEVYKGDRQPIGTTDSPFPFKEEIIPINNGDTLYLFTDGYADQFGGAKCKKFGYKRFRDLLLEINEKPMGVQEGVLAEVLEDWRQQNNEEQVDDICVIGIKF